MNCLNKKTINHFHLFCGLGGGAKGFNQGSARLGNVNADFQCIGGVDSDASAIADFNRLTGVTGTVLDLFDRDQYRQWHGHEPPKEWREATPEDIRKAAGNERPHIVFTSAPCKGFSGLLSEKRSTTDKYQALNKLTLRGVWLTLEAWADDPPEFILFENVPRIANRGRGLLDQIQSLLNQYGYATAETTHDCGELGQLAQSRKRFLLVARHIEKVPPFLYEPIKKPLKAVGDVIGQLPLPGDLEAGPMHRIPSLQWKTWVRLAFVEAGSDWRSLNRLRVKDGFLKDYLLVPEYRAGFLGVNQWEDTSCTVSSRGGPTNGCYSVADPRYSPDVFQVADPRGNCFQGKYTITSFDTHTGTVISGSTTGQGAFAVADPRSKLGKNKKHNYHHCGRHYGVVPWDQSTNVISGNARHDNGYNNVADPRLPEATDKDIYFIKALDNTWHRPFTTLELAALQGLVDPEEEFSLEGKNDGSWRERIGNAVPAPAAAAIASVMGEAILLAQAGETFTLGATPLWVRPIAVALSVKQPGLGE